MTMAHTQSFTTNIIEIRIAKEQNLLLYAAKKALHENSMKRTVAKLQRSFS